jgi:hypothetical protein
MLKEICDDFNSFFRLLLVGRMIFMRSPFENGKNFVCPMYL